MPNGLARTLCVIASLSLLSGCATWRNIVDPNTAPDGTKCTRDSEEDGCSRYLKYHGLEGGFKDHGFDQAHRHQGYENLREQRRQQREQRQPSPSPQQNGNTAAPPIPTVDHR